jgi:transcriptional regulator with XRE-family HTH domain
MKHPRNIVGTNVRRLRNAQSLSQAKLAAKCQLIGWDISREGIAKIEGRVRWVADTELVYLCDALGVKPETLLGKIK